MYDCEQMQVLATAVAVGLVAHYICGQPVPAAIVIGNGLALSSTAVVLQVNNLSTVCFQFFIFQGDLNYDLVVYFHTLISLTTQFSVFCHNLILGYDQRQINNAHLVCQV